MPEGSARSALPGDRHSRDSPFGLAGYWAFVVQGMPVPKELDNRPVIINQKFAETFLLNSVF